MCIIKMANSHFLLKNDRYTFSCMHVLKNLAGIFFRGKSTKHEQMRAGGGGGGRRRWQNSLRPKKLLFS